jgi:hypothetical protein
MVTYGDNLETIILEVATCFFQSSLDIAKVLQLEHHIIPHLIANMGIIIGDMIKQRKGGGKDWVEMEI